MSKQPNSPRQEPPTNESAASKKDEEKQRQESRKIPGNLPWTPAVGVLKTALSKIITGERPPQVTADFLDSVFGLSGGSARAVIPILKKVGYLDPGGAPTERYSQFKAGTRRSDSALEGLRAGFSELFKRNEYAHKLDQTRLKALVVEVTGLPANDRIVGYIVNTFQAFQIYVDDKSPNETSMPDAEKRNDKDVSPTDAGDKPLRIGVANNINIILPETTNVEVYNIIFKSLRDNLLR
ncbi:MAG: DUF5343 domain-containing protein [Phreatobacter sp.]|nr:DUF5343 domain-containing protein [Phreatobacter sp.]